MLPLYDKKMAMGAPRASRRTLILALVAVAVTLGAAWSLRARRTAPALGIRTGVPAVLHFHMDCPACKQTRAALERVQAAQGDRIQVVSVDVRTDASEAMVERYGVKIVPALVALDVQGLEAWRNEGPCDEAKLRENLGKLLGRPSGGP